MPVTLKKVARLFFIIINILVVIPYLLVCLVPFLPSDKYWIIAVLGLFFPIFFGLVLFFLVFWLLSRSKWFMLSLIALLLSFQQLSVAFALHRPGIFDIKKSPGTLRVLSWNVTGWDERNKAIKKGNNYRQAMMNLIQDQNADVLCLQEFFESNNIKYFDKNIPPLEQMGFTYHCFVRSIDWAGHFLGITIFSRYPITDTAQFSYGNHAKGEHLVYADIKVYNKIIRVMTTHLQSVELDEDDLAMRYPRELRYKLKLGYGYRTPQARIIRQRIQESPYPVIFCGDVLDIPNSYTYFTIRGDLQDAFLKKGLGFGQTSRFFSPTLRIDYIFADKKFKVQQFNRMKVPYSDHYPIVADFALQ